MMTLEEIIKHHEKLAEAYEQRSKLYHSKLYQRPDRGVNGNGTRYLSCLERVKEHRQLVALLKELKKYRIAHWKLKDMDYEYDLDSMFGKNPMYYGEDVWNLFGDIDASVEYEVKGYEGCLDETTDHCNEATDEPKEKHSNLEDSKSVDVLTAGNNIEVKLADEWEQDKNLECALGVWIPVTDRYPDEDDMYLVTLRGGYVITLFYSTTFQEYWTFDGELDVIAWMPYPKPYVLEKEQVE